MTTNAAAIKLKADAIAPPAVRRPVVVYDSHCGMCRRTMRMVRACDWLGSFDHMAYDDAIRYFPQVSRELLDAGIRVLFPDGSVTVGIEAVRSIAVRTPLGFVPGLLLYLPPVRRAGDRAYRAIAARRNRDNCSTRR